MIVDSHQHVIFPTDKQLAMMDEAGIDKTILFCTTVHPEAATDLESFAQEIGILNEILSGKRNSQAARKDAIVQQVSVIQAYPSRFIGFGIVPVGMSEQKTAECIKAQIIDNNFRGLGEFTLTPGKVSQLEPIFAVASDFGNLPLWIHTFSPLTLSDIKQINQLSKKYPAIPVILGHLGGTSWLDTIKLAQANTNLYLDLSAAYTTLAVSFAIKELPGRSLFSSDAPYGDPLLARNMIERLVSDRYVREKVLGGTIAELLS